jgi:hypothetical protein
MTRLGQARHHNLPRRQASVHGRALVRQRTHHLPRLLVSGAEVRRLQACPVRLFLREGNTS